jgi:hypothetical protein
MESTLNVFSTPLPQRFVVPSLYESGNIEPEEFAAVLIAGVNIVASIRSDGYMSRINDMKAKLLEQERKNNELIKTASELQALIITSVDEAVNSSMDTLVDNLKEAISSDKREREGIAKRLSTYEEAISRRGNDMNSYIDRISEVIRRVEEVERMKSSVKGIVNEKNSHQLIIGTFGGFGSSFSMQEKKLYSCDHIFDWNGLRILWEDKDYMANVNRAEIEKAYRDFDINQDCHVLLFVSANSAIVGHECSSGIDAELRNGRLILFVSHFKQRSDPQGYIRNIIQPIIAGMKNMLLGKSIHTTEQSEMVMHIFHNLKPLITSMVEQEKACDMLASDMKARISSIRNMIGRTKLGIEQMLNNISSYKERPEKAVSDEDRDEISTSQRCTKEKPMVVVGRTVTCSKCGQQGHNARYCKS